MSAETTSIIFHVETPLSRSGLPAGKGVVAAAKTPPSRHHTLLRRYRGAAVMLRINGVSASGVLCFAEGGHAFIASLCFTEGDSECPLFSHVLADHEIATLRRSGPRHLTSAIAITHAGGVLHADCHA